ncbi:uncharacterized protein K452DRAFT_35730 [Neofusicoccum parvum]|uniref:Uncharacterized protein K452DRAFT_35730 n=1 Tax=Neofusicoccum parvum TaxID=310453 RepID=A0ACB5RSI2_9PEZI|nr:uncharacterized protein K452DRAFT_35730 [Neofusicoccum parvum]
MVDITPQSLEQSSAVQPTNFPPPLSSSSLEASRLMLGDVAKGYVASTLREIRGLLPLVQEGILEEVTTLLTNAPDSPAAHLSIHLQAHAASQILYGIPIRPSALPSLHASQITALEAFNSTAASPTPWPAFIKIDPGYRRAGLAPTSPRPSAPRPSLSVALAAAALLDRSADGARVRLELHAGNFVANDLQQLGTGCVGAGDLAEVCSVYPERGEAVVNAGAIALGREAGPIAGYGRVVGGVGEWVVGRVWLHVQHACIAAAAHHYYFVVDNEDVVREVWWPWKGW